MTEETTYGLGPLANDPRDAEIARLKAEAWEWQQKALKLSREAVCHAGELERLKAEVERLTGDCAALRIAADVHFNGRLAHLEATEGVGQAREHQEPSQHG